MNAIALILMSLLTVLFYGYFINIYTRRLRIRRLEGNFFHAVVSVLENNLDETDCIEQIEINFKKISEKNPSSSGAMKTALDLLEDLLNYYDTLGEKKFMSRFNLDFTSSMRNRTVGILNEMKLRNPFVSLSPEVANLFADLKHAIDSSNSELGKRTLRQLAEQSRIKDHNLRKQERKSNTSIVVAIIGAVLTFLFGALSLSLWLL